jgi:membrane-bound serine protease (ClpP class)
VIPILLGVAAVAVFLARLAVKSQQQRPVTGAAAMIGEIGRALTAIEPGERGRVVTHGEIWTATAQEPIASGDPVSVTGLIGLTLTVRKA